MTKPQLKLTDNQLFLIYTALLSFHPRRIPPRSIDAIITKCTRLMIERGKQVKP